MEIRTIAEVINTSAQSGIESTILLETIIITFFQSGLDSISDGHLPKIAIPRSFTLVKTRLR